MTEETEGLETEIRRRLSSALRSPVKALKRVRGGGYTPAGRYLATLGMGKRVFVKAAVNSATAKGLNAEYRFYSQTQASFLPEFIAFDAEGDYPLLVLEDLSAGFWPPPWNDERVRLVLQTLEVVGNTSPPFGLPLLGDHREQLYGWPQVEEDPQPFLSVGICSEEWLKRALPALRAAAESAPLAGDQLLHLDVRSDNLCLLHDRAALVDWDHARVGDARLDVAGWLSSLHFEGGPLPEEIMPDGAAYAALMAGFFASRAGLPTIPEAPHVRTVQRTQLQTALPWAARALGLPPPESPDGPIS